MTTQLSDWYNSDSQADQDRLDDYFNRYELATGNLWDEEDDDDFRVPQVVMPHGWRPRLRFFGDGPMYLGMELEVEASYSIYEEDTNKGEIYAASVMDRLGETVWIQEDSSIGNGFEITTHPMAYDWAMQHFPFDVLSELASEGCYTNGNVGIHVHVSRNAFASDSHVYRWMKFIYRNEPQVVRLARRANGEWASFDDYYRKRIRLYAKKDDRYGGEGDTRYRAINSNGADTFEVRVFASSLKPEEVKAALAFCASTVDYTGGLDASKIVRANAWGWESYVDWLRSQPRYRPILDELEALACVS